MHIIWSRYFCTFFGRSVGRPKCIYMYIYIQQSSRSDRPHSVAFLASDRRLGASGHWLKIDPASKHQSRDITKPRDQNIEPKHFHVVIHHNINHVELFTKQIVATWQHDVWHAHNRLANSYRPQFFWLVIGNWKCYYLFILVGFFGVIVLTNLKISKQASLTY